MSEADIFLSVMEGMSNFRLQTKTSPELSTVYTSYSSALYTWYFVLQHSSGNTRRGRRAVERFIGDGILGFSNFYVVARGLASFYTFYLSLMRFFFEALMSVS